MEVRITKKDIFWSYIAQFFSIASGLITLPFILNMLSTEEIALNYLLMAMSSLLALFQWTFCPQIARNISYIFTGVTELKREGISDESLLMNGTIDFKLLSELIGVSQLLYRRITYFVFIGLISLGSIYIYSITNGFTSIDNIYYIWFTYVLSASLQVYFAYYDSLLLGTGKIKELKQIIVISRVCSLIITFFLLFMGMGLLAVSLSALIIPFISRFLSYKVFYTIELKRKLLSFSLSSQRKKDLFEVLWYNGKKQGLNFIGGYCISKMSFFLSGLFLPMSAVASFGLLVQIFSIIQQFSNNIFDSFLPKFASLRASGNKETLVREMSFSIVIFYFSFSFLSFMFILLGKWGLNVIHSNAELPSNVFIAVYALIVLLEQNHSDFAGIIAAGNKIPFVLPSLLSGLAIICLSFILLKFTFLDLWAIILSQGIVQAVYNNWKWPVVVLNEFSITFKKFISIGFFQIIQYAKRYVPTTK